MDSSSVRGRFDDHPGELSPAGVTRPVATSPGWVLESAGGPLATVDRRVPEDVSAADLSAYCLMLGDDALVLAQRLSQWCHRAPELEEDVALLRLDRQLLTQARMLLTRAGEVEGQGRDENELARDRPADRFRNVRLVELDCGPGAGGDFAASVARLLVCATWRTELLDRLADSRDAVLAAIARYAAVESREQRDHAAQWCIRLGETSAETHERMRAGLARMWPMVGELFTMDPIEGRLAARGYAVAPDELRDPVTEHLDEVLSVARMEPPDRGVFEPDEQPTGRVGSHTASLQFLLAEMRYTSRADGP